VQGAGRGGRATLVDGAAHGASGVSSVGAAHDSDEVGEAARGAGGVGGVTQGTGGGGRQGHAGCRHERGQRKRNIDTVCIEGIEMGVGRSQQGGNPPHQRQHDKR
jgi:hypothetical protein